MKLQIISLVLIGIFSAPTFAGPGGTGGIGTVPTLRMNGELMLKREEISAITTRSGDYARLEDLEEGFAHFRGVSISKRTLNIHAHNEIHSVLLSTGEEKELVYYRDHSKKQK